LLFPPPGQASGARPAFIEQLFAQAHPDSPVNRLHASAASAWWPRCLPFGAFIALLAARGAIESGSGGATEPWLYAVQAAVPFVLLLLLWRNYTELREVPRSAKAWIATAAVGIVVFGIWINADSPWMRIGEPIARFIPLAPDGSLRWDLIAVRIAGAAIVVPIIEELFWRSFLMRWLDRRDFLAQSPQLSSRFALIASSAVFALEHDLWLAGFVAGLAYGYLYQRTGNLWYPIAAHAVTNLALGVFVVGGRHWQFW